LVSAPDDRVWEGAAIREAPNESRGTDPYMGARPWIALQRHDECKPRIAGGERAADGWFELVGTTQWESPQPTVRSQERNNIPDTLARRGCANELSDIRGRYGAALAGLEFGHHPSFGIARDLAL
jgi:hypothetical protein